MDDSFRLLYQPPGLPVHIVIPSPNFMGTKEQLINQSIPVGMQFVEVHASQVPQDLYFRNAWDLQDNKVAVNMDKAKKIHVDNLRGKREELFKKLDVQMHVAQEKGDLGAQKDIIARKQKLRDMPSDPVFNTVSHPEHLKELVPDYMKD